jgi:predicted nucleic acid-binding protein
VIAVIDASVVIKWLLQNSEREAETDEATLETPDCVLITADERYLRAARAKGRIVSLTEWQ